VLETVKCKALRYLRERAGPIITDLWAGPQQEEQNFLSPEQPVRCGPPSALGFFFRDVMLTVHSRLTPKLKMRQKVHSNPPWQICITVTP
jgi:hypothetical protein